MTPFVDAKVGLSKQIIPPFIFILIIVKFPALLLVGLVLAYIIIQQNESEIGNMRRSNSAERAQTSCYYYYNNTNKNKNRLRINTLHYPIKHENGRMQVEEQEEEEEEEEEEEGVLPALVKDDKDSSNSSLDFERFPTCPTTLPRLDTHFNFVEDTNHIDKTHSSNINWKAIHQELEYDQQRENIIYGIKKLPTLHNTFPLKRSSAFGSQDKLRQIPDYTQPFLPREIISQKYEEDHNQAHDDAISLYLTAQPTNSGSFLLKNKIRKAVNKIKQTTNKTVGQNQNYKASAMINSYDDFDHHHHASFRIHDHVRGKLNKLFKK